ncbi:unnamed protein product [Trifolium pratense]|uniref:Uncharacterized protein n=1 Tax=Trifolium pratense TaxID=57577 RepID=A0ACB0KN34_TRIPR|nr:unnamed protein product [Trifolium pratense]
MNSHSCIRNHLNLHFRLSPIHRLSPPPPSSSISYLHCTAIKLHPLVIQHYSSCVRRNASTQAFDKDSFDFPILDDWSPEESTSYVLSSSDGEDFDGDVFLTPVNDVDLPSSSASNKDALTVAAHRLVTIGRGQKKHRIKVGLFMTMGLVIGLTVLLLYVDWCVWKIVRLPLSPFYLTRPFLISAILVSFVGYVCVPIFGHFKSIHVIKQQGPLRHQHKRRTHTLGGLFFVPIGIIVAHVITASSSIEVAGASGVTIAFAAVGLLSDILNLTKNHWRGLPELAEVFLEVAVGTCFSFWLDITSVSSSYGMYTFLLLI